jgi:hypothetical protein
MISGFFTVDVSLLGTLSRFSPANFQQRFSISRQHTPFHLDYCPAHPQRAAHLLDAHHGKQPIQMCTSTKIPISRVNHPRHVSIMVENGERRFSDSLLSSHEDPHLRDGKRTIFKDVICASWPEKWRMSFDFNGREHQNLCL